MKLNNYLLINKNSLFFFAYIWIYPFFTVGIGPLAAPIASPIDGPTQLANGLFSGPTQSQVNAHTNLIEFEKISTFTLQLASYRINYLL